jgi:phospholipase C
MNGMQNQNGAPQFNQNSMNQIQQAANALQQRLQQANTTPQQYLEMAMQNGSITQDQYQWARQMANAVMGTKY